MAYTNSPMVAYKKLSPNHSGQRTHSIDRITPHCVVGQCTAEGLGDWFALSSTQASSNYGIDKDGRVGLYVEEKNRSWCSSSSANDQRAITIECASDTSEPYAFRDVVYQTLIKLCTDICQRNGKKKLLWLGDKDKTLNYSPAADEMILTVHRWFANKSCPGNWMYARMNKLIFAKKAVLDTLLEGIRGETHKENLRRIDAIDQKLEQNVERRQTLTTIMTRGYLDPALFTQESNDLAAEADALTAEKDQLVKEISGNLHKTDALGDLIQYAGHAQPSTSFDGALVERFLDHAVLQTRDEIVFHLKCGLRLTERIGEI